MSTLILSQRSRVRHRSWSPLSSLRRLAPGRRFAHRNNHAPAVALSAASDACGRYHRTNQQCGGRTGKRPGRLRDSRRTGPRRDGRRLQGPAHQIESGGGAEDDPRGRTRRARRAGTVPHRGEAIARLQHPGIVQIHEVGEQKGRPFFSLEFCPGGSLDDKLAASPLPPPEAATLSRRWPGCRTRRTAKASSTAT